MHQDIERVLLSEEEIAKIVERIAEQINIDYQGKDLMLVGLLKGSISFMADLMKKITLPCRIDFIAASSYGNGTVSQGRVNILKDVSQSVDNVDILIVEDIIDSGNTLSFISKYFAAKNAGSVKICTLLNKPSRRQTEIAVDYVGIDIPDEFVVGYGLDYAERYRNLPYIGILKPSVYS